MPPRKVQMVGFSVAKINKSVDWKEPSTFNVFVRNLYTKYLLT